MYIANSSSNIKRQNAAEESMYPAASNNQKKNGVSETASNDVKETKQPVVLELSQKGLSMSETAKKNLTKIGLGMKASTKAKTAAKKKKSTGNVARALAIARRIMKGDKVPPKDEQFLFQYNSDLYLKAKMMAAINANPKKHKSLLDDEQEESGSAIAGAPSAPAESAASESGASGSEGADSDGESEA